MILELGTCGCCQPKCDFEFTFQKPFSGTCGIQSLEYLETINRCVTHYLQVDISFTATYRGSTISGTRTYTWNRWTGAHSYVNSACAGSVPYANCAYFYNDDLMTYNFWVLSGGASPSVAGTIEYFSSTNTRLEIRIAYPWGDGLDNLVETIIVQLSVPYTVDDWMGDFDNLYNTYTYTELKEIRNRLNPTDSSISFYYNADGTVGVVPENVACQVCNVTTGGVYTWTYDSGLLPLPSDRYIFYYYGQRGVHFVCTGTHHCKRTTLKDQCGDSYPSTTCETVIKSVNDEVHIDCDTATARAWVTWEDNCTCP